MVSESGLKSRILRVVLWEGYEGYIIEITFPEDVSCEDVFLERNNLVDEHNNNKWDQIRLLTN